MRRFVLRFLVGALAVLVLYEGLQRLDTGDEESAEEALEEAAFMAARARSGLSAGTAQVVPITEAAYQQERSRAFLLTRLDGIEVAIRAADGEADWRVAANLSTGPVSLDASTLTEEDLTTPSDLLGLVFLLLGVMVLGIGLIWSPTRQLRQLAVTARALRDGDLDARAEVPRGDLSEPVALAMNEMAAQIQKVVEWQELVLQTVAHELRTPLSRVRFVVERVADAGDAQERDEALMVLDDDLTDLEDVITSVLLLIRDSKEASVKPAPVDLGEIIEVALDKFERRAHGREPPLRIRRDRLTPGLPKALVDRVAVGLVFDNLLANAAAHANHEVRVVVDVQRNAVMIAVEDDGEGVSQDLRDRIFEPFVRLDDGSTRLGAGLGLVIVKRITEAHGYSVAVAGSELGGLRLETRWPLAIPGER
jgi:two-component system sensor histidine kinase RstB